MTLEGRMQALLALVEEDRAQRCDAIATEAQSRAGASLRDAHREARVRVRDAFAEERRRAEHELAAARAKLATQRRHAEQRRAAQLLEAGLAHLPAALERRWHDPATRSAWIDAIVARAEAVLPRTAWRVVHPAGWDAAEMSAVAARIAALTNAAPAFVPDARIAAGLRVTAGGIVVDGTQAGLLADRAAVGARLLGVLESLPVPERVDG